MKPQTMKTRLTSAACAALLLCLPAAAQRRRPAQPPPAQTPAPRAPAPPRPAPAEQPAARAEISRPFEDLLAAESYGVYAELRRAGTLVASEHVRSALAGLRLTGELPKELTNIIAFAEAHAETLADSRVAVAALPAREGLPPVIIAVELETPEAAAAFEPKFRAFVGEGFKNFTGPEAPRRAGTRRQQPAASAAGSTLRRAGNWLLAATEPFTLKKLRGPEENALSGSPRFQSARTRFSSEHLFVYLESDLVQQGWMVQMARDQRQRERLEGEDGSVELAAPRGVVVTGPPAPAGQEPPGQGRGVRDMATAAASGDRPAEPRENPNPEGADPEEVGIPVEATGPPVEGPATVGPAMVGAGEVVKPTEEQRAVRNMNRLFSGIFSGIPRIPAAVAFAATLEGDSVALRVAVENPPEGIVNIIPFLPNVISGPPVTNDAAEVAPADAAVFVSASLDWQKMYTAMLGTADLPASLNVGVVDSPIGGGDRPARKDERAEKPPSSQETIAAVEKLFGFKFKEDLLPALGNELAVSVPFSLLDEGGLLGRPRRPKEEPERDAEPGLAVIVSLNDPDKIKQLMPRLLAVLGAVAPGSQFQTERREGFEVRSAGVVSYAVLDKFLVVSDKVKAVRHVVDSYASRRTLSSTAAYRDSTQWQPRQRLLHAYLSEALMRHTVEDTKKRAAGSPDPVVQALLAQMSAPPEPASYGAANEGERLVHEARLPLGLVKTYALGIQVGIREAPVMSGEMMAVLTLQRIRSAQLEFKEEKKKGRYGTLEELVAEKLIDKRTLTYLEYNIELSTVGDRLEISATPKNYGKTGRRSFFLDAEGVVRGADHKGQPATADDPPVD